MKQGIKYYIVGVILVFCYLIIADSSILNFGIGVLFICIYGLIGKFLIDFEDDKNGYA